MHGYKNGGRERNGYAMQYIEAQKSIFTNEAAAQQQEAGIRAIVNERYAAHTEERGARPFVT